MDKKEKLLESYQFECTLDHYKMKSEGDQVMIISKYDNKYGTLFLAYSGPDSENTEFVPADIPYIYIMLGGKYALGSPVFHFYDGIIPDSKTDGRISMSYWASYDAPIEKWLKLKDIDTFPNGELVIGAMISLFAADKLIRDLFPGYCLTNHELAEYVDFEGLPNE